MQKKIVYSALAVPWGGAGFALRRWELATAFEETGLVTPGMPATLSLIALSAVAGSCARCWAGAGAALIMGIMTRPLRPSAPSALYGGGGPIRFFPAGGGRAEADGAPHGLP